MFFVERRTNNVGFPKMTKTHQHFYRIVLLFRIDDPKFRDFPPDGGELMGAVVAKEVVRLGGSR